MTKQRIDKLKQQIVASEDYLDRLQDDLNLSKSEHPSYVNALRDARVNARRWENNLKANTKDIERFKRKISEHRRIIKDCEKRIKELPSIIRSQVKRNPGKAMRDLGIIE